MWFLQLVVFGLLLACFRLSDARFLGMIEPTYRGVEEQKPADVKAEPAAEPERGNSREAAQQANGDQQRRVWPEIQPLAWKFPEVPVQPENKPPKFEQRKPEKGERVAVRCGESRIQVEVSQDLLGLGRMIKPEDLALGGCSATEVDDSSHVLVFESELHGCGSRLVMTESAFIYAFTLVYKPRLSGRGGIIRRQSAVIGVECHYPR